MAKRKPRNKMAKKVDLLYPISIEQFGTEDDPCFGKLNDPRESACQNCGDFEVCAIVQSQNTHLKREKIESKTSFKDLQEVDLLNKTTPDRKEVRKKIKNHVRKTLREKKKLSLSEAIRITYTMVPEAKSVYTKIKLEALLKKLPEKSDHITYNDKKMVLLWK